MKKCTYSWKLLKIIFSIGNPVNSTVFESWQKNEIFWKFYRFYHVDCFLVSAFRLFTCYPYDLTINWFRQCARSIKLAAERNDFIINLSNGWNINALYFHFIFNPEMLLTCVNMMLQRAWRRNFLRSFFMVKVNHFKLVSKQSSFFAPTTYKH